MFPWSRPNLAVKTPVIGEALLLQVGARLTPGAAVTLQCAAEAILLIVRFGIAPNLPIGQSCELLSIFAKLSDGHGLCKKIARRTHMFIVEGNIDSTSRGIEILRHAGPV